jgi:hypothetical protein
MTQRTSLSHLPWPVRLTLAMFLCAAGVGYLTGLIQLHFAHASEGNLLPSSDDVVKAYHGSTGEKVTHIVRLLEAPETMAFNGAGSMRKAFTDKSDDWKDAIKQKPEATVKAEREGERLAMLAWLRDGAKKETFEKDAFPLPESLTQQPITIDFLKVGDDGKEVKPRTLAIKSLFTTRCAGCHGAGGEVAKFQLETYDGIAKYNQTPSAGGMSLEKLALVTHTHMMAFAVLFGATGLAFSFTRYPSLVRAIFGPWTLFFQIIDIGMWWASRLDPFFAKMILVTGGLVGIGLGVQLLGGLYDVLGPQPKRDNGGQA